MRLEERKRKQDRSAKVPARKEEELLEVGKKTEFDWTDSW
jgi:hypothetical protein